MSTKPTVNVRIKHKYDTYENWKNSSIVLEKGELAIVEIENSDGANAGNGLTPPTIGIKVGDGESPFANLDWIQAIAGDVQSWAKIGQVTTVDAIGEGFKQSLASFISSEVPNDTNTKYTFEFANDKLIITPLDKNADGEYVAGTPEEITLDLSTKVEKVTGVVGNIVEFAADGAIADSGVNIDDYYNKTQSDNIFATKDELSALDENLSGGLGERVGKAEGEIDEIQAALFGSGDDIGVKEKIEVLYGEGDGSVKKQVADAVTGIINGADEKYDTLKEISDFILSDTEGVAALINKVEALDQVKLSETANIPLLNSITSEKVDAWTAAEGNAKSYADEVVAAEKGLREDAEKAIGERIDAIDAILGNAGDGEGSGNLVERVSEVEEQLETIQGNISTLNEATVNVSSNAYVSGEYVTKDTSKNTTINAIPMHLLTNSNVENFTLIFDCGSASTVI